MTDKEKLKKIVSFADKMYDAAFNLTTDASLLRKAMDDYHQFIIKEYHKEEPVSGNIDFEQELYKAFGQVKDFTLGMQIAKRFYDMGKNSHEPVSDELEEAVKIYTASLILNGEGSDLTVKQLREVADKCFKAGAKWQKQQMMAKAIDAKLLEGHLIRQKDVTHPLHVGDKVKIIVIKED